MSLKEQKPSEIRLSIQTCAEGKVTVTTDLRHAMTSNPLTAAERLAVEWLSIASYSGHTVSPMPDALILGEGAPV